MTREKNRLLVCIYRSNNVKKIKKEKLVQKSHRLYNGINLYSTACGETRQSQTQTKQRDPSETHDFTMRAKCIIRENVFSFFFGGGPPNRAL